MGVFETLLILDGAPIELDAHLGRLSASARELFDAELPSEARDLALEHASPLALGRLRLTVAPEAGGALAADVVTASVDPESVFPAWERAIALQPFVVHGGIGAHKWADRSGLAWAAAMEAEGGLPLVLDVGGEVLEASRANLFCVADGKLLTPALDGRILPGISRARAIEAARSLAIEVREETLGIEQLIDAGEAFLTGSVRGIEPVRSVGEAQLGTPGEAVREVAAELRRIWMGKGDVRWTEAR
jgi:para-aminobenzoate synthetase/4-amino-4-deoxychorismate lyase